RVLTCTFTGPLQPGVGNAVTINLSRATTAADCGALPNAVRVSATHDTDATDNTASFTDHVICPDVRVTKTGNGTINAGETATFTITVTNDGPGTAFGVTAHDTLPSGTWTLGGANAGDCSITAGVLNCSFGTLTSGASRTITLSRATTAADCGTLPNTVTVAATNEASTTLANNSASATDTVICPNVRVAKTGNGTVSAGEASTFTITVTNDGPGAATNVTVHDTIPSGSGLVWVITGGTGTAGCSITSNVLDCTYATMAVGSVTIILGATTNAASCGA